jgi:hypothetical protein
MTITLARKTTHYLLSLCLVVALVACKREYREPQKWLYLGMPIDSFSALASGMPYDSKDSSWPMSRRQLPTWAYDQRTTYYGVRLFDNLRGDLLVNFSGGTLVSFGFEFRTPNLSDQDFRTLCNWARERHGHYTDSTYDGRLLRVVWSDKRDTSETVLFDYEVYRHRDIDLYSRYLLSDTSIRIRR